MRWALLFFILTFTYAKEEETNEVNPPPKIPINLDANLRRALLKALTELENEENDKKNLHVQTSERIVEKASASALSFYASTDSSPTTREISTTEEITHKPIVVIQKSHGLQHRPITNVEKYPDSNENEQIITSASSSFTSSSNKLFSKSETSPNAVSKEFKGTTKFVTTSKPETTTVTTTTSTEENEAKVEDVQFFSAPLVAAFTVHQDERGLPKSVEPIYRTTHKSEPKLKTPSPTQGSLQQEQIRTHFALQEKQQALEAEILRLKQQQQHQNYLIRQQQILHQQQLQLQKQKILDEQSRLLQHQTQQPFLPTIPNFTPSTTQRNDFNRESLVSFQPSLSFSSHQHSRGLLPQNAQQLPVKNYIDFRSPFTASNNIQQFNYLRHQQPPLDNNANFHITPSIEPPLTLTAPKPQAHRVFRQETNTGNFLNNNGFSSFNHFHQVPFHQNQNRFFRSNVENFRSSPFTFNPVQPPVVNQQLNHLLYNSGLIKGKQQEDLNIVSKVLSLNHYGGDYKFSASNVNEQKVAPPVIKKV